jgi:TonB family protein
VQAGPAAYISPTEAAGFQQQKQRTKTMKAQLLMLSAAGLLLASAAQAAPPADVQQFLDSAHRAAVVRLEKAGVALAGRPLAVRATVDGAGRFNGLHVVRSSGSSDTDAQATAALRRMAVDGAPYALAGRDVTLTFGDAPIIQAKAP